MAWLWVAAGRIISPNASAYCQARKRLPASWLDSIRRQVADRIEGEVKQQHLWHGRNVIVIDGSGISMPDTAENQKAYPQSKRQKPGCGFPVARLVAAFSLVTGAMLEMAWGALGVGERTLLHRIWDRFRAGDVALADRGFCGYADFWVLMQRGIDCVMRKNASRSKGVLHFRRLGKQDRIVLWIKTKVWVKWMDKGAWAAMPETLAVREIAFAVDVPGFRTKTITVATTLLDEKAYPKEAFADLYRRRWLAELFLRDIKISMGMDVLRCRTPEMVDKEIRMHLIAYNLIRGLMFQAAITHGVPPFRISFKGTTSTLRQWMPFAALVVGETEAKAMLCIIIQCSARDLVPDRPNRIEPRALKRRKKNYQLLNKHRSEFKEIAHRSRYKRSLS
jgi:hypothetical protein